MSTANTQNDLVNLVLVVCCAIACGGLSASAGEVSRSEAKASTGTSAGRFNGKIVFASDRHNSSLSLWSMNPDGSSPTRLTDGRSRGSNLPSFAHVYDITPVWSPDGSKIAFGSNRNSRFGIYIMNADGSNVRLLTDEPSEPGGPVWSPDGSRIAFTVGNGGVIDSVKPTADIYVINVDGSGLTKLTQASAENYGPTWSPDSKQIAFASNRETDWRIWVMNADGTNQRRLTDVHNTSNGVFYKDTMPAWSPDGSRIVFNGYRDFNGTRNCAVVNCSELFIMNADGSNDRPITNDPNRGGLFQYPKWSPDGAKILTSLPLGTRAEFAGSLDQGRAIIVMNADGSNPVNISNRTDHAFFDVAPDWQPLASPPVSTSSIIGFSAANYSALEDSGSIRVTVNRTGNLNDVASCSYRTQEGTATIRNDYGPALGTLRFAAGQSSKIISIPLTYNSKVQGGRSFKVTLSDNEGNATFLGGIRETTVTVLDRDSSPRTRNPIDDTAYFVANTMLTFSTANRWLAGSAQRFGLS